MLVRGWYMVNVILVFTNTIDTIIENEKKNENHFMSMMKVENGVVMGILEHNG